MRGIKVKALRKVVGYKPTRDRPELPDGGYLVYVHGRSLRLPKDHPRRQYHVIKKRYGMLPFASLYKRVSMSREMLDSMTPQGEARSG